MKKSMGLSDIGNKTQIIGLSDLKKTMPSSGCYVSTVVATLEKAVLKGTVQRKLTGVESDIKRKVFLSH